MQKLYTVLAALLLIFPAAPLDASPITASIEGCVASLPNGMATWSATEHFQFVAFWDSADGCEPTTAHPVVLHEWLENFDGAGGLKVQTLLSEFPKCGRVQFDAHAYLDGANLILDPLGLVSLVVDTGLTCEPTTVPFRRPERELPEPSAMWLIAIGAITAIGRTYKRRAG